MFGIQDFTSESIHELRIRLENQNNEETWKYMIYKIGFDYENPIERAHGFKVLVDDLKLLTSPNHKTYKFICQMYKNYNKEELA